MKREEVKKVIFDALTSSSYSGGSAIDHIVDALIESGALALKETEKRRRFGEYGRVLLTEEEYERLQSDYPGKVDEAIKYLDEYIKMSGKKYKDHNLALRKWVFDAVDEQRRKQKQRAAAESRLDFNLEDIFEVPAT